jgi:dephospho-CoA kinase
MPVETSCVAQGEPRSEGVNGRRNAPFKKPFVIGVTGGMASGKSTVASMIAGRAILHVDADRLVHRLMRDDRDTIAALSKAFPKTISHNRVDRALLAQHITQHPEALVMLEHLLHPRVRAMEEGAIIHARRNGVKAVVLDVPLLFETGLDAICDVVLVAHAPLSLRRQRAFKRHGMSDEKWNRLLDRQLPSHIRNRLGDHVIHTALGKAATRRQVMALIKEWGLR